MILERIAQETGVSETDLRELVRTASYRYKTYQIPKKTGGYRVIDHPSTEVKFLQRWLNRNLLSTLPVHESAFAYRNGRGIADNARLHVNNNYLLKIDFKDFFSSLKHSDVKSLLEIHLKNQNHCFARSDIDIIVQIVCKHNSLTIGAPSSPLLSNTILYDFDCFSFDMCEKMNVTYSRYADDIFMSTDTPNKLAAILEAIRSNLRLRASPRLTINDKKTVFTSKKRRRIAAGVVLTSNGRLSIGRKKKRHIRSLIHLYSTNMLSADQVSYLCGYLSFVSSVEPEFIHRVRQKYGRETVNRLMREEPVTRKNYRPVD